MGNGTPVEAGAGRWPIRLRLPLLNFALLLVTVAMVGGAAWWEVRRGAIIHTNVRLGSAGRQIAALLAQSVQQRTDEARHLAAEPSIVAAITTPSEETRKAADQALEGFLAGSPQTIGVELWTGTGQRLVDRSQPVTAAALRVAPAPGSGGPPADHHAPAVASPPAPDAPAPGVASSQPASAASGAAPGAHEPILRAPSRTAAPDTPGLGPLQAAGTLVYYEIAAPVEPSGMLVLRRSAFAGSSTAEAIGRLMGGTFISLGSPASGVWTDFSAHGAPPANVRRTGAVIPYTAANGERLFGLGVPVADTPWLVWVATPHEGALGPADLFLRRMIWFGLIVTAIGAAAAWLAARRITRPLDELTHKAETIAAGDLRARVAAPGSDEIGRLGRAFNTMAEQIADSHQKLDARVQERTGELERALATLKDTQEELVRREKLAMLGQLASGVGHELRNPLAVMTNAVYFLEMIQPDAPAQVHEYHGLLRAQIGLSEKIVSDLLDFARIKPPRRETVTLTRLIDEQLARTTVPDNVRVVREVSAELPGASVDPVQMGQVLINLLVNAMQAMEEQGGVLMLRGSLGAGPASGAAPAGSGGPAQQHLRLDVIDTGPGVPPGLQEKIFEALYTTKARGIGLGLAVSRSLAEANGGRLTVSSEPGAAESGGGATFTVTFPLVTAVDASAPRERREGR